MNDKLGSLQHFCARMQVKAATLLPLVQCTNASCGEIFFSGVKVAKQKKKLYRRQLDLFQFLEDVSPLVQEASSVTLS